MHNKVLLIPWKHLCHKWRISNTPGFCLSLVMTTKKTTSKRNSNPIANWVRQELEEVKLKYSAWVRGFSRYFSFIVIELKRV